MSIIYAGRADDTCNMCSVTAIIMRMASLIYKIRCGEETVYRSVCVGGLEKVVMGKNSGINDSYRDILSEDPPFMCVAYL